MEINLYWYQYVYNDSNLFNDPNLIMSSIVIPLKDFGLILAFVFCNVHSFSTEWFEIKCVWLAVEIGRNKLPHLMNLFFRLTANNFAPIVMTSMLYLNSMIVLDTENAIFVPSSATLEIKLLVGTISPVIKDQLIVMAMILRNVKNHVAWKSAHNSVVASLVRSPWQLRIELVIKTMVVIVLMICLVTMMMPMVSMIMPMTLIVTKISSKHSKIW